MHHEWTGPNMCIATACAAGSHAVGEGARLVRDGTCDVVMAGGTEASITPVALAAFARMGALSTRADDPTAASRPFDAARDGFVMGEGAAFLVLERYDRAVERGAEIYGEIIGYGRNADAFHITAPSEDGAGAVACMHCRAGRRRAAGRGHRPRQCPRHVHAAERRHRGPVPWARSSATASRRRR